MQGYLRFVKRVNSLQERKLLYLKLVVVPLLSCLVYRRRLEL
jgi:hypothetical protein